MHRSLVGTLLLVLTIGPVAAQQGPPPCSAPEYRQFDFWAGSWAVVNPQGVQVGSNTITPVLGGCALHEQWQSAGAHAGFSYNIYDRASKRWHQTWVDNSGLLLLLDGTLSDGSMVLTGPSTDRQGREVRNRITWTPITADSVRQLWETSVDSGATWGTVFDGRYVRRK
ncbi:MAG: hypothetical protein OER21_11215 [Gemmatimonadota bacterium]|nr:hypothetical protein [Gemmatimonadota bacterium]